MGGLKLDAEDFEAGWKEQASLQAVPFTMGP